jgi:hypothetical protein
MSLLSDKKPIKQPDFGPLPNWNAHVKDERRKIAHEEVCRDLEKSPEHLLVDTHDESLDLTRANHQISILRTLARMASMQLKIERAQRTTNWILFFFALLSVIFSGVQAWFTVWPRTSAPLPVTATVQSSQPSGQSQLVIPIAPVPPLKLEVTLQKEASKSP